MKEPFLENILEKNTQKKAEQNLSRLLNKKAMMRVCRNSLINQITPVTDIYGRGDWRI